MIDRLAYVFEVDPFSRDRKILFANIQTPGTSFAIQGPFRRQ